MNIKINLFNKNEKYDLRLYNIIQMNYKLQLSDKPFNIDKPFNFNIKQKYT